MLTARYLWCTWPSKSEKKILVHSERQAQVRALLFNKAPTKVLAEYSDYSDVFLVKNAVKLSENSGINEHAIKLEEDKQLLFGSIYSLGPIEFKTLKTYIKTNLANGFIRLFKSSTKVSILFNRKSNRSFCFYINYWGFNNITIKNQYPLLLIGKLLDWLGWQGDSPN